MAARSGRRLLTIGGVLAAVRDEFPDVTISKIRFLESEGLLTPTRTPSGYRQFDGDDVDRLRYILRAQRDHFWPLKVIREALDALDRGLEPPASDSGQVQPRVPHPTDDPDLEGHERAGRRIGVRLTQSELAASAHSSPEDVAALVDQGLLHADAEGFFDEESLRIAHAAAGLARYGVEARHLRGLRAAADRQVGLIQQASSPHTGAEHDAAVATVTRHVLHLHAALLRSGLRP